MDEKEQKLKALDCFKDWSNYLLVTTVAALGWVAAKESPVNSRVVVWCFAISAVFGIFTLALVPLVAEGIKDGAESIYDVQATFSLFWFGGREGKFKLKYVCWPQHIFFIFGIIVYAAKYSGIPMRKTAMAVLVFMVIYTVYALFNRSKDGEVKSTATPQKHFCFIGGIIMGIVALAHFCRVIFSASIVIGGWTLPPWLSLVAAFVAGFISFMGFKFAKRK